MYIHTKTVVTMDSKDFNYVCKTATQKNNNNKKMRSV